MSGARKLQAAPAIDRRQAVLANFADNLEIGAIDRIVQRGRDPLTAPYTIHMADGAVVRVGTIKTLRSQPALGDVLAVTLGRMPPAIETKFWHDLIGAVVNCGVEVEEAEGESYADRMRELVAMYCENATADRDGAMAHLQPFTVPDEHGLPDIYLHAVDLQKWLDRHHGMKERPTDLHIALADIGFERRTINYYRGKTRASRSYWVAPVDCLTPPDGIAA